MKGSPNRALAGILAVLACFLAPLAAQAAEQIVYFKNGRALRVLDVREEGDWVYLIISEPMEPEKKQTAAQIKNAAALQPEDLAREMGVHASTIDRVEMARTAPGGSATSVPVTRTANGMVQRPDAYDTTGGARGYVVKELTPEEIAKRQATHTERLDNTPTTADGPASAEAIARSNEALDNVDLSKTLAGGAMRMNQRNLKVPNYIMDRARQVQEQRRQDRAARRLAAQKQALAAAGTTPPATPPAPANDSDAEPER